MSVKSGAVFLAKVITSDVRDLAKISISKYVMDTRLTMYFKETTQYYAVNSIENCKEGDYVLARKLPDNEIKKFSHVIEKVIYTQGNYIDPISGKKCAGTEYIDDIKRLSDLFGTKQSYLK